jgi:hypothetical protein
MEDSCSSIVAKGIIKCKKIKSHLIYKIKIYDNFYCYDEFDNFLGKGELVNGNLKINYDSKKRSK